MKTRSLVIVFAVILAATSAHAACTAKIVQTTHAQNNARALIRTGEHWGPPTQLLIDPATSAAFICAHGSYCYESDGIKLDSCRVYPLPPVGKEEPGDPIIFGLGD